LRARPSLLLSPACGSGPAADMPAVKCARGAPPSNTEESWISRIAEASTMLRTTKRLMALSCARQAKGARERVRSAGPLLTCTCILDMHAAPLPCHGLLRCPARPSSGGAGGGAAARRDCCQQPRASCRPWRADPRLLRRPPISLNGPRTGEARCSARPRATAAPFTLGTITPEASQRTRLTCVLASAGAAQCTSPVPRATPAPPPPTPAFNSRGRGHACCALRYAASSSWWRVRGGWKGRAPRPAGVKSPSARRYSPGIPSPLVLPPRSPCFRVIRASCLFLVGASASRGRRAGIVGGPRTRRRAWRSGESAARPLEQRASCLETNGQAPYRVTSALPAAERASKGQGSQQGGWVEWGRRQRLPAVARGLGRGGAFAGVRNRTKSAC
jgi:hypothetical protein